VFIIIIATEPKMSDLLSLLYPVQTKWRTIGLLLDIKEYDLDSIGRDPTLDDAEKLAKVFQCWMEKKTTEVSWNKILEVIRNPPVGNEELYQQALKCLEGIQPDYASSGKTNQLMEIGKY
jgi:hypothetical protein